MAAAAGGGAAAAASSGVLGVRREDKNRWERRAPVAPMHVAALVKQGYRVLVQPSTLRTFADSQYAEAGAEITEDLSPASTILAVKEVPIDLLMKDKTYVMFSHTIKAQQYNMGLLDAIVEKNVRLLDYEAITDEKGVRLVRFGKFAGFAGMVDTLHSLGDRLLAKRHSTPFLHIGMSYVYSSVSAAKAAVAAAGEEIASVGLPEELSPMTFVFTSTGNVSQGAREVFEQLPHEMVTPEEMAELVRKPSTASRFKVYGCIVEAKDVVARAKASDKGEAGGFDKSEYYDHPERYASTFYERMAPYVSVIVNCMYWDYKYPHLLTSKEMRKLVETGRSRLLAVGDISCDPAGSIQFLIKTTSIDNPCFVYDPLTGDVYDHENDASSFMYKDGVLFCAIDNFPTEFPKEATQYFGDNLLPLLPALLDSAYPNGVTKTPSDKPTELPAPLAGAIETQHGGLTPKFEYIKELRARNEATLRDVLVIGAGYVSAPCVDYFLRWPKNNVTVCDYSLEAAQRVVRGRENATALALDVCTPEGRETLEGLVRRHGVVVSLVPAPLTIHIARACVDNKTPMVSASYISDAVRELDAEAKEAGVLLLNEVGLDPGIDHLEALRMVDSVHARGGKVRSFVSWCGGLPLPEASGNPLAYKFSWAPRGVLTAASNPASYIHDGRRVNIAGADLLSRVQEVNIFPGFALEGFPNRDATKYLDIYGIRDEAHTFFRGTLRYPGFAQVVRAFHEIGFLDPEACAFLPREKPSETDGEADGASAAAAAAAAAAAPPPAESWDEVLRRLLPAQARTGVPTDVALQRRLTAVNACFPSKGYDAGTVRRIVGCARWLGLFDKESAPPTTRSGSLLDALCVQMLARMQYEDHEADLVILHHMFEVEWPHKSENEVITSTLVERGRPASADGATPGVLAMSRCVGLPVAIAADLILSGDIKPAQVTADRAHTNRADDSNVANAGTDQACFAGVMGPTFRELYGPLLAALGHEGLRFNTGSAENASVL